MDSIVSLYEIEPIQADVDKLGDFTKDEREYIRSLFSDRAEHVIKLNIVGVSDSIANAIRRTLIDELRVVALDFDISNVDTNDEYIISDELRDRIRYIPIDQNIPENTVFSISQTNSSSSDGVRVVYSNVIPGLPGKFRIAELKPGGYLSISEIKVVAGYGYNHSMFSLTSDICFDNMDYMDVHVVNQKGNILTRRVSVNDVFNRMKESGIKSDKKSLYTKKILVIPSASYDKLISDRDRNRIKVINHDVVLINRESPENDNLYIVERSSTMCSSREFAFAFYMNGNIDPKLVVPLICNNLIDRLQKIAEDVSLIDIDNNKFTSGMIFVSKDIKTNIAGDNYEIWSIKITGETHTIGEMLFKHILELDPGISNVKKRMNHPRDKNVYIDIVHSNPLKILTDAINLCIGIFKKIHKSTSI